MRVIKQNPVPTFTRLPTRLEAQEMRKESAVGTVVAWAFVVGGLVLAKVVL